MITRTSVRGWERARTTRLYVHPPLAERIVTLWPDFKVINGRISDDAKLNRSLGHGFHVLYGNECMQVPWQETRFRLRDDGIPVHAIEYDGRDFAISMECFCSMERSPALFCRITLENDRPWPVKSSVTILPRSGRESYMMCTTIDSYQSYEPNIESWGMLPSQWKLDGGTLRDPESAIVIQSGARLDLQWREKATLDAFLFRDMLRLGFALDPGESIQVDVGFFRGKGRQFDYDAEMQTTIGAWKKDLARITTYPMTDSAHFRRMFLHLVAQGLQMFARFEGKDFVIPRQGGIVHWIWPWEASFLTAALDRIGLHDYSEKAYEFFSTEMQIKDGLEKGRIKTIGIDWACQTSSVLYGLSVHLLAMKRKDRFMHYRQMLIDCFEWVKSTREKTLDASFPGEGKGLFPPMISSDWPELLQSWSWTDTQNIIGLHKMHELFCSFEDDFADTIRKLTDAYTESIQGILDGCLAGQEQAEEVRIPNKLGQKFTDPPLFPYGSEITSLINAGFIKPGSRTCRQLEAYFRNRNWIQNGLTGLMMDSPPGDRWCGHTWYIGVSDMAWFYCWLASGDFDKAEETFFALTKYGMTEEFSMQERYADNDPTYVPWSPNASNNGRMIMMMLDYFARRNGLERASPSPPSATLPGSAAMP